MEPKVTIDSSTMMNKGFLEGKIKYTDIPKYIAYALEHDNGNRLTSVNEILSLDEEVKQKVY